MIVFSTTITRYLIMALRFVPLHDEPCKLLGSAMRASPRNFEPSQVIPSLALPVIRIIIGGTDQLSPRFFFFSSYRHGDLARSSSVCRSWAYECQPYLYEWIRIREPHKVEKAGICHTAIEIIVLSVYASHMPT